MSAKGGSWLTARPTKQIALVEALTWEWQDRSILIPKVWPGHGFKALGLLRDTVVKLRRRGIAIESDRGQGYRFAEVPS